MNSSGVTSLPRFSVTSWLGSKSPAVIERRGLRSRAGGMGGRCPVSKVWKWTAGCARKFCPRVRELCFCCTLRTADPQQPMTKRNPIECDEFYRLRDESLRLYAEWDAIRGEVNQTPKTAPDYPDKVRQLKQSQGKWHHASQDLNQHVRDHRCRYSN